MANRPEINKRGPPSIGYKRVVDIKKLEIYSIRNYHICFLQKDIFFQRELTIKYDEFPFDRDIVTEDGM